VAEAAGGTAVADSGPMAAASTPMDDMTPLMVQKLIGRPFPQPSS
jgi:hypothetical protein